jgi:NADPH2:quinone reductase
MSGTGFEAELGALDMLGRIVVFGNAARHPSEVPTNYLLSNSKSVLGFWLVPLVIKRRDVVAKAVEELLGAVASGKLEVVIGGVYPMSDAARAHVDMQERRTSGKLLLDPAA